MLSHTMSRVIQKLHDDSHLYTQLDSVAERSRARLTQLLATPCQSFANAFLVEKAGKTTLVPIYDVRGHVVGEEEVNMLRVSTDARLGNAQCADDASFPLFTLEALLQTVSNVSRHARDAGGKAWYVINVDLRHWFHQLPMPPDLQHLFILHSAFDRNFAAGQLPLSPRGIYYVPRAVPMGWMLAPRIAQAATWSLLVGGKTDLPGGLTKPRTQPAWLPFVSGPGGVFALIDNILIVTPFQGVAYHWANRLTARARECNVEFKDIPLTAGPYGPEQKVIPLVIGPASGAKPAGSFMFCGIQFDYSGWRVAPRDRTIEPERPKPLTFREVAALLGETLWDLRVRRVPPRTCPELMDVYTAVAPRNVREWDEPATITDGQLRQLIVYTAEARRYHRREMLPACYPSSRTESYAVDACAPDKRGIDPHAPRQLAWVRLTDNVEPVPWAKFQHADDYIGEAELRAIVEAVRDARRRAEASSETLSLIHVATDSRVAQGWAERDYSSRPVARELLAELAGLLGATRLACYYVSTKDNVADEPSRTRLSDGHAGAIFADRLAKTKALLLAESGRAFQRAVVSGQVVVRRPRDEES